MSNTATATTKKYASTKYPPGVDITTSHPYVEDLDAVDLEPTKPRLHGQRPHPLMDELAGAQRQVSDVIRRLRALTADADIAPAALPIEPTTGEPRRVKGEYRNAEEALADARLVIQQLAGMLRPFALFREVRVIDAAKEPRTVCDVVLPMSLVSQINLALDQAHSFAQGDSHLRERLGRDSGGGEVVSIKAA